MENKQSELLLEEILIRKGAMVLRAVNHKLRQKMMHLIHEGGRMTVTSIYTALRIEQSVASQHLAILRRQNLLITEREGKYIFYSVNYQRLKELHQLAEKLIAAQENE